MSDQLSSVTSLCKPTHFRMQWGIFSQILADVIKTDDKLIDEATSSASESHITKLWEPHIFRTAGRISIKQQI